MAYELHIRRQDRELSLEEWCSAVRASEIVRLTNEDAAAVNPTTREEIRVPSAEGDAEVLFVRPRFLWFGPRRTWERAFRFSHGRATFRATKNIESPKDAVHRAAVHLARVLDATIVGDGGEVYDW